MDRTRTLRGISPQTSAAAGVEPTATLRGLGFTQRTLRGLGTPSRPGITLCPCCQAREDAVSADLSATFGIALVLVKGIDAVRPNLCEMHRRMLALMVDEIRAPKRLGDDSWDD